MTLEEMAVKAQERKILDPERKIDMNIIMLVSLCLSSLLIINVVLCLLIDESKSNALQPVPVTLDARVLLKERREERATLAAESVESINSAETLDDAVGSDAIENDISEVEIENLSTLITESALSASK